jgi:hypothetical protein
MPTSPERAVEIRIAEHLGAALQTLVRTERGLSNDEVIAGSAEFLTRVCVMAFVAERDQGYPRTIEDMAEQMDALTGAIAAEIRKRLRWRWTP